jgi:hypothetical protein
MRKDFKEAPSTAIMTITPTILWFSAVNDVYKIHKTKTRDR